MNRSFLKKPTFPPKPASSVVSLVSLPQVGNMASSLVSIVRICLTADLRLRPDISLMLKAEERLSTDMSLIAASYCKLCLIYNGCYLVMDFEKEN